MHIRSSIPFAQVCMILACFFVNPFPSLAGTSSLWGVAGEKWDPRGRLPDFSYAGYHAGEKPIPSPKVTTNVTTFGAKGDGKTDDSVAIQKAIDATPANGVLFFPKGRYLITRVLYVRKSNVVLRGAGSGSQESVLYLTKNLTQARGPSTSWRYGVGGFLHVEPLRSSAKSLGNILVHARRGDTTLTLNAPPNLKSGEWVELRMTGDKTSSLWNHLHNEQQKRNTCDRYDRPVLIEWPVRVAQVRGKLVTLSQPLRQDVRTEWSPTLNKRGVLEEVGIEKLRIEFVKTKYPGHLKELGYNGIYFKRVRNSWVREVTIVNADNGITATSSKGVEIRKLTLEGRYGHHGVSFSRAYDCLLTEFEFRSDWRHSLTVDHLASGNVTSNGKSKYSFSMDHHRDVPFENLFSNLQSKCTYASGGNSCAGPHSAARGTFWNLFGVMSPPKWGSLQTNLIGRLSVATKKTTSREWYENISSLTPPDLHTAQRKRRLTFKPRTRFGSNASIGDRKWLEERDPARWRVLEESGGWVYQMMASGIPILPGSRLGETSILKGKTFSDVTLRARGRVESYSTTRDIALILGYRDDENYLLALFHGGTVSSQGKQVPNASLCLVKNGVRTVLARASRVPITDASYHDFVFARKGNLLEMRVDGQLLAQTTSAELPGGRVGVGTWNDKVRFADLQVSSPSTGEPTGEPPMEGGGEPTREYSRDELVEPVQEPSVRERSKENPVDVSLEPPQSAKEMPEPVTDAAQERRKVRDSASFDPGGREPGQAPQGTGCQCHQSPGNVPLEFFLLFSALVLCLLLRERDLRA